MGSNSVRVLFVNGGPERVVSDDTTLAEVEEYYRDKLGERARYNDYRIEELFEHPEL